VGDAQRDERMLRWVIAVASAAMLAVLLLPPYGATPDEAKYIGLGLNILDGRGLITVFGVPFPNHSPVWPLLLAVPQRYLGIDALAVGHVLNAVSAAVTVALSGVLGWRVRPAAGALAAVVMLAFPFLSSNARTAGLDLPATALTLGFFVVALRAIDLRSTAMALGAGVLFGLAFLVKETALPFFPVPFLAALLTAIDMGRLARLTAAAVATAAVTVSWWFLVDAGLEGTVYRLGTPAWTLGPIAVVVVVLVLVGWNAETLARRTAERRARVDASSGIVDRWRAIVAWGGIAAWALGQLFVYARAPKLAGQSLFRASQWVADLNVYLPHVAFVAGFGVGGVLVALLLVRRSQGARELVFATIAGVPLILLVLAIGETPRHYLANIAVLVALAAAGWMHGLERARVDRRWGFAMAVALAVAVLVPLGASRNAIRVAIVAAVAVGFVAAWILARATRRRPTDAVDDSAIDEARERSRRTGRGVGLATLLAAALIVFVTAAAVKRLDEDRAREQAVDTVSTWINATVAPGDTVALSPLLAYELALEIRDEHPPLRIRPGVAIVDAEAPLGLRWYGTRLVETPLAIDTALRNVDQLDVYGAELLEPLLDEARPAVWIDAAFVAPDREPTSTTAMFAAAAGMTPQQEWRFPLDDEELLVTAWAIDPDALAFDESTIYADARTVEALVRLFRADGGGAAAGILADRIQIAPPNAAGAALLDELRALGNAAGGGSQEPSSGPSTPAP